MGHAVASLGLIGGDEGETAMLVGHLGMGVLDQCKPLNSPSCFQAGRFSAICVR
ncbi:MAG: hypothetical protein LBF40_09980 [Deltaproteobacteria bacterium]|nr:hypothetical protein [Deltaproteobacteria bacterium]